MRYKESRPQLGGVRAQIQQSRCNRNRLPQQRNHDPLIVSAVNGSLATTRFVGFLLACARHDRSPIALALAVASTRLNRLTIELVLEAIGKRRTS